MFAEVVTQRFPHYGDRTCHACDLVFQHLNFANTPEDDLTVHGSKTVCRERAWKRWMSWTAARGSMASRSPNPAKSHTHTSCTSASRGAARAARSNSRAKCATSMAGRRSEHVAKHEYLPRPRAPRRIECACPCGARPLADTTFPCSSPGAGAPRAGAPPRWHSRAGEVETWGECSWGIHGRSWGK